MNTLKNFSKFFAYRYGIDETEYKKACVLEDDWSYGEFSKMAGHHLERNGRPEFAWPEDIKYIEGSLVGYYDSQTKVVVYKDIHNKYKFNSSGYRMPKEISGTEDFIFSGCSHTVGEGVPEEAIWGVQVANAFGLEWANLAVAGRSVEWAVENVFGYLSELDAKPKVIALLLPEFSRFQIVNNPLSMISKFSGSEKKEVVKHGIVVANVFGANYVTNPKYSERPHWFEEVISAETLFMHNMRAIKALAMYCKAANITLVWSTWCMEDHWILSQYAEELGIAEEFVDIQATSWHSGSMNGWKDEYHTGEFSLPNQYQFSGDGIPHSFQECEKRESCSILNCHSDLEEKYGWNFHIGTDKHDTPEHSHFGVHKHTHFAEEFIKRVREKLG